MNTYIIKRGATGTLALIAWLLLPQAAQCFYNPSTGRWLARDPVGEHGFFKGSARMLARTHVLIEPYRFASNDPIQRMDYLGLAEKAAPKCCAAFDETKDCYEICKDARKDAKTFPKDGIGTVVCYHRKMCSCILGYDILNVPGVDIGIGHCAGLDKIVLDHEGRHEKNSECKKCGLYPAPLKPGVNRNQEECTQRRTSIKELEKYIAEPITPDDSIECKKAAKALKEREEAWVKDNCPK
jgi:RHS repeat-associated protein